MFLKRSVKIGIPLNRRSNLIHRAFLSVERTTATIDLEIINGRSIGIKTKIGNGNFTQILNTGNTYTQLGSGHGSVLGLVGHHKIFGLSRLADGSLKFDYLCRCDIVVGGVTFPIVVKVGPSQPILLGLDIAVSGGMIIDLHNNTVTLNKVPSFDSVRTGFAFLDYSAIMHKLGLLESDLTAVHELPSPEASYATAIAKGNSHICLDLGTATSARAPY